MSSSVSVIDCPLRAVFFISVCKARCALWCCVDADEGDAAIDSEIAAATYWKWLRWGEAYSFTSCLAANVGRVSGKRLWYFGCDGALPRCHLFSDGLWMPWSCCLHPLLMVLYSHLGMVRRKDRQDRKPQWAHQLHAQLSPMLARESPR